MPIETSPRRRATRSNRPRRPRSLIATFAVLSLVIVLATGVLVGLVLRHTIRERVITDAARTAEIAVGVGVIPVLEPEDLAQSFVPLSDERIEVIEGALGPSLSPNGIVRLKVWNLQHWLVYSDNPNLVGRWFAGTEPLEAAFAGEVSSDITDLSAPEEREERQFGELLSVYVPLRIDAGEFTADPSGTVVGAFEIYLPYAPIAAQIREDTTRLLLALGVGLTVLYLALYRIVARASRTIRRQGAENLRRASEDELTGLVNRERFQQDLTDLIVERRSDGGCVDLLLFDVDGFQTINDTLGHDRGDIVLRHIADRLRTNVRSCDVVARLGGDEYGVIVDGHGPGDTSTSMAERLLATLSEPVEIDGIQLDVRCSVGISRFPDDGDTASDLLRRADIAMYSAKRSHGVFAVFDPALDHFSADALALVGDVRNGIARGDFWLAFQPQVAIDSGELLGYEALVRWEHPERGLVPPDAFIPALEALPACRELTDHVISLAVRQLAAWREAGFEPTVAVNLSARDTSDHALPSHVAATLSAHQIGADRLHLELTESAALANPDATVRVLRELRALGCGVAIDDFGTGFASVSYLTSLPVTCLKIDRSFVDRILDDAQSEAVVRHSIELGHALGMTVVAEGIENEAVLAVLGTMGCDVAQGYFIDRPRPAVEIDPARRRGEMAFGATS